MSNTNTQPNATPNVDPKASDIAELLAKIAKLEAEAAANAKASSGKLSMKVSEKGGVSVYGLGRFPVTLYGEQWIRLIDASPRIVEFIKANQSLLATKAPK